MSATSEQLVWANYQNNKFIKSAKVELKVINKNDESDVMYFTNYDKGYSIIKSISSNANASIIMNKIPNNSFVFELYSNDYNVISTINNFLDKGQTMVLTYEYDVVDVLSYSVLLVLESFNVSPDGTLITINGVDKTINYLMNQLYDGLICNNEGSIISRGVSKNGSNLANMIYGLFQNYTDLITHPPIIDFNSNITNGLIAGFTKAEALQYILQASMGYQNNNGGVKVPAIPLYSYKQVNTDDYYFSFSISNGAIITDLNPLQVDYDNSKIDKFVIKPLQELEYPIIKYEESPKNLSIKVYSNETSSTSSTQVPVQLLSKNFAPLPSGTNRYTDTITNASYVTNVNDIYTVCYHNTEFGEILTDIVVTPLGLLGTSLVYQVYNPTQRTVVIKFYVNKTQSVFPDVLYNGNIKIGNSTTRTETISINYDSFTYGLDSSEIEIRYDNNQIDSITNIKYYNDKIVFTATRNTNVAYDTQIPIKIVGTKITSNINQLNYLIDANGSYDIEIDNPLITSKEMADNVANALTSLLASPLKTIEIKCRIDPSICLLSIIKVIDKLRNEYYVWVNEYNYIFNGGFTGVIKGLIIDSSKYLGILEPPKYTGYLYDSTDFEIIIENKNSINVNLYIKDNDGSETIDDGLYIQANSFVEITPDNADQKLIEAILQGNLPLYAYFQSTDGRLLVSDVITIDED